MLRLSAQKFNAAVRVVQQQSTRTMATNKKKSPPMEEYFNNKKFIVTGASEGMGKVIASRLLELNAKVFGIGLNMEQLNDAENLTKMTVDVSNWDEAYNKVFEIGPVHGLVNNAGVAFIQPFLETTKHGWDHTLNVNCRGILRVSQAVAKNMIADKINGSIVNTSSTISELAIPDHVSYCASKGAVRQITNTMAVELGPYGIRTNNVSPTVVLTEMGKRAWSDPEKSTPILKRIPLGRFAEPEDISDAVVYLLSDRAKMVNGASLYVCGGFMSG